MMCMYDLYDLYDLYVLLSVCSPVRMYSCMYVCTPVYFYLCMNILLYSCMLSCMYVLLCVCVCYLCTDVCMRGDVLFVYVLTLKCASVNVAAISAARHGFASQGQRLQPIQRRVCAPACKILGHMRVLVFTCHMRVLVFMCHMRVLVFK